MNQRTMILIALILGSGVALLDGTVVNLALPWIGKDLGAGFTSLQWIIDAYLLIVSSLILVGGSLGDIFGRKKIYLIGLFGFGITSLLCGLSPTTDWLIGLRMLQGLFGALLIPGALAIINSNFPKEKRGMAIGVWSGYISAFAALGPLVGGYILNYTSWRWIFFINIPLVVICAALAIPNVIESKDTKARKVDILGATFITLCLGSTTYSLIEGPIKNWNASIKTMLLAGILFGAVFIWWQQVVKDPIVDLKLFKSRNFSGSNLMTFAMYGALGGFIFSLVIYLQTKMGYGPIKAALSLLPITILMVLLSRWFGALANKYGPRMFMTIGPLLSGIALLWLINFKPGVSYSTNLLPSVVLFGLGMTMLVAPLTYTVMASVKSDDYGVASGINNAVSRVSGLLVVALLGIAGAGDTYRFSMALCAGLALSAGIISFLTIQNPRTAPDT